jgi:hypothetical protein
MGKPSRRRKQQQRRRHHNDRVRAAGRVPAPNFEGATVEAVRHALALVTSMHASPDDLPALLEDLVPDPVGQGLVANALLSQFIAESARFLADAFGTTVVEALGRSMLDVAVHEADNRDAWDRAFRTARTYAEVLDNLRAPQDVGTDLVGNLGLGLVSISYLVALTQIAHQAISTRCAEAGEDVGVYLRRVSLPAAEEHGNEIEADAVEDYVGALIDNRLSGEPRLLADVAAALRRGDVTLPDESADEFDELGGSDQLKELGGHAWDDLEFGDQRLLIITLLESVLVNPNGTTVGDRVRVVWRF